MECAADRYSPAVSVSYRDPLGAIFAAATVQLATHRLDSHRLPATDRLSKRKNSVRRRAIKRFADARARRTNKKDRRPAIYSRIKLVGNYLAQYHISNAVR